VRSARKHIGWALRELPGGESFRSEMNRIDDCALQLRALGDWFARLGEQHERLPRVTSAPAANDDLIELTA
jgi:tRNA-dihydrouridine synthase B